MQIVLRRYLCWLLVVLVTFVMGAWFPSRSLAYTPESPEVRRMAEAAMAYLEEKGNKGAMPQLGAEALVALAAYKYNLRYGRFPHAVPALTEAGVARAVNQAGKTGSSNKLYSTGIALMLLSEIHPGQHASAMTAYVRDLLQRQKPQGAWGYLYGRHKDTGDLSQTQYAVLGLWSAKQAGMEVPRQSMVEVFNYVIRVQDPSGGWPYQGKDPGHYNRVGQSGVLPSRTAAGLGSLYIGADFLGITARKEKRKADSTSELPPVFVPVEEREERSDKRPIPGVNLELWMRAVRDGQQWLSGKSLDTGMYQFYHLYSIERMYSFKDKLDSAPSGAPRWYDEGVELLRRLQSEDGSWGTGRGGIQSSGPVAATAFGVLFLVRGTQLSVEGQEEREGILRGGRGLPTDSAEARVRGGRIVVPPITGEVEDLISMLEDEAGEKIERMLENPGTLSLRSVSGSGGEHSARLARIVRGGQSYKARIVAVRALSRQGNLDNVPVLIHALTDPDPRVVRAARDGLRLISRKFNGFGLSDEPSADELQSVIRNWKAWYKSVRPDAVF